jgi:hypothetical protein
MRRRRRPLDLAAIALLVAAGPTERVILPPVVVSVSSTALTVVNVSVPDEFGSRDIIAYEIEPLLTGAIVGKLSGIISAGSAPRTALFAVRAPRRLMAGQVPVANVRFTTASLTMEVPVVAEVATWQGVTISFSTRLIAAAPGIPVPIGFRLTNTGNAPDEVAVTAIVPAGWIVLDPPVAIPLGVLESMDAVVRVVPPIGVRGVVTIRLVVSSRGQPVAESSVDIQVAGDALSTTGVAGPTLRAGFAIAAGPWAGTSSIQSVEMHGPVSDGLSVRGRVSSVPQQDAANYALSRAGIPTMPLSIQLAAPEWRVDAGTLGTSVSDLAGVNLVGRGASVVAARPNWVVTGVAVSPDIGFVNASGSLAATRFEFTPGAFSLSTAASRLRETRGGSFRSLDALSIGGAMQDILGGHVGAEIAHRRVDETMAAGWSATYLRRTPDESLDLRYVHAPGGSRAFARASEELSANISRKLSGSLHVTGGAWRSADQGIATLSALTMSGLNLGASFAIEKDLHLSVNGHTSGFDARTGIGVFGSGERAVVTTLDLRRNNWSAEVSANVASIERTTSFSDTSMVAVQSAPRGGLRGLLTSGRPDAMAFSLTAQYERSGPGVGAAPEQWSYGVRFNGRPGLGFHRPLRLELAAERVGGSFEAARSLMLRAGVELDLPLGASLLMSAERNPWVVPAVGSSDWMYVVGVARTVSLSRPSARGTRGVVYRDVNGNGRRESSEPGFAGVMLRRGGEVAVTDDRGAFLLMGDEKLPYQVDARSLPLGWISPSTAVPAGTRHIGALSVSPLEIELVIDAADSARVLSEHLAAVVVSARDSTGREWAPRRLSDRRLVFDAVPPGSYTIIIDPSGSREPLRAIGELSTVVRTGQVPTVIRVVMQARQLRFTNQRRVP